MKTTLTEEAALLASRRAHELGVTPAEYLRDLVMVNLYGAEHMLSLYRQHLKVIGQNGARNGTSGV